MAKQDEFGDDQFEVGIGAEAIKKVLNRIDLDAEKVKLRADLKETSSEAKRKKLVKRLKLIEAFGKSGCKPGLDNSGRGAGHSAGTAAVGAAGWWPFRDV